jgi:hypothetical protein
VPFGDSTRLSPMDVAAVEQWPSVGILVLHGVIGARFVGFECASASGAPGVVRLMRLGVIGGIGVIGAIGAVGELGVLGAIVGVMIGVIGVIGGIRVIGVIGVIGAIMLTGYRVVVRRVVACGRVLVRFMEF